MSDRNLFFKPRKVEIDEVGRAVFYKPEEVTIENVHVPPGTASREELMAVVRAHQNYEDLIRQGDESMKLKDFPNISFPETALKCYEQAIKIDPQNPKAWYKKAGTLIKLKRYTDAVRCWDNVLELDTNHNNPNYILARGFRRQWLKWIETGVVRDGA